MNITSIQAALGVKTDGIIGKVTLSAIADRLSCAASVASIQAALGVKTDGIIGRNTLNALAERLGIPSPVHRWPSQAQVRSGKSIFGKPGDESNLIMVDVPYTLYYGKTPVNRIRCHKLIADDVASALREILTHYGQESIRRLGLDLYDGCYNYRSTSTGKALSMHAWGIALDFAAAGNAYATRAPKATLSRPECAAFWEIWERHGFVSLGRAAGYDWMHVQAATL